MKIFGWQFHIPGGVYADIWMSDLTTGGYADIWLAIFTTRGEGYEVIWLVIGPLGSGLVVVRPLALCLVIAGPLASRLLWMLLRPFYARRLALGC